MAGIGQVQTRLAEVDDRNRGCGEEMSLAIGADHRAQATENLAWCLLVLDQNAQRGFEHRHSQTGWQTVTRDVGYDHRQPAVVDAEDVEVVAADGRAGLEESGEIDHVGGGELARQQTLLQVAGDPQLVV
jgi:hypothetical protein